METMVMVLKERKTNEVMWEKGRGNSEWQCCGGARGAANPQFITLSCTPIKFHLEICKGYIEADNMQNKIKQR